jgi:hypothetical protein
VRADFREVVRLSRAALKSPSQSGLLEARNGNPCCRSRRFRRDGPLRGYTKREGEAPAELSFLGKNAIQQELRPPEMPPFGLPRNVRARFLTSFRFPNPESSARNTKHISNQKSEILSTDHNVSEFVPGICFGFRAEDFKQPESIN